MEYTINFVGVAGAIFVSFAVALGLEWLSLVMMMRLMPRGATRKQQAQRWRQSPHSRSASDTGNMRSAGLP